MPNLISIVLPAKNEDKSLLKLLPVLKESFSDSEIIVVNDGSTDDTAKVCEQNHVKMIEHAYSKGNGAAIKTGARHASCETLIFMDADGQHDPAFIGALLKKYNEGFDLVIGARDAASQASIGRLIANTIYNKFASYMVNQKVLDMTSGFRVVNAKKFSQFMHLFPNGFSYPTTSTMAFYRSGYSVAYVPIKVKKRAGNSHIRIIRDGVKFLLILFKIGTLYSPLKIFFPFSFMTFATGISYYMYTFLTVGRFTNMSALLLSNSVLIFLIGLVSEQITTLIYQKDKQ